MTNDCGTKYYEIFNMSNSSSDNSKNNEKIEDILEIIPKNELKSKYIKLSLK